MTNWKLISRQIAAKIWESKNNISLVSEVENWLVENSYDINSDEILNAFDNLKSMVSKQLQGYIQQCDVRGIIPKYQFSVVDADKLIPLKSDEYTVREELSSAINLLSWRAFEHLCAHTMTANGVTRCEVTRAAKEQGIDLIGMLDIGKMTRSSIWHDVQIRVLGQAKFSKTSIVQDEIRLFNEDMRAFANGEGRAFKLSPDWAKSPYLAQVGFVFSLNGFTSDAKKYAKSYCIALKDVEQISQDLVCSNAQTPGLTRYGSKPVFMRQEFLEHFAQLS